MIAPAVCGERHFLCVLKHSAASLRKSFGNGGRIFDFLDSVYLHVRNRLSQVCAIAEGSRARRPFRRVTARLPCTHWCTCPNERSPRCSRIPGFVLLAISWTAGLLLLRFESELLFVLLDHLVLLLLRHRSVLREFHRELSFSLRCRAKIG